MKSHQQFFPYIIFVVCAFTIFTVPALAVYEVKALPSSKYQLWADTEMAKIMSKNHKPVIPGAVLVVVKDGQVIVNKSYGYSNVEKKEGFDPEVTILRAASLTKTVTATAIMQLIEQKKLTADTDIRPYFPELFNFSKYPYPITVGNLLTHTNGLDETSFHYYSPDQLVSLEDFIKQEVPKQADKPNTILTYSNYGYNVLGRLIEIISGETYEDYIAAHVLIPLEMENSTVHQPLSQEQLSHAAKGHLYNNGTFSTVTPLVYRPDISAGGLTTTASDMANYLVFHSQENTENKVLSPNSLQLMHAQHFTNDPLQPGWTYGFYERYDNGQRVLVHGGNLRDTASLLAFIPSEHIGFFVYFNTPIEISSGSEPREELLISFLNTFYPEKVTAKPAFSKTVSKRFEGSYRITRYIHSGIEKAFKLDGPLTQATVVVTSDGKLQLKYPFNIVPPTTWNQIGELTFQRIDKPSDTLAFREDGKGNIQYLFGTLVLPFSLERVAWYDTIPFHLGVILVSVIGALLLFVVQIIFLLVSWRKKKMLSSYEKTKSVLRIGVSICILVLMGTVISANMTLFAVDIIPLKLIVKILKILFIVLVLAYGAVHIKMSKKTHHISFFDGFLLVLSIFFSYFLLYWS